MAVKDNDARSRKTGAGNALPGDIREAVAINSAGASAMRPAMLADLTFANTINNVNLSQQNAVAGGQAADQLTLAVIGGAVDLVANPTPLEGVALAMIENGGDASEELADLTAKAKAALRRRPRSQ